MIGASGMMLSMVTDEKQQTALLKEKASDMIQGPYKEYRS